MGWKAWSLQLLGGILVLGLLLVGLYSGSQPQPSQATPMAVTAVDPRHKIATFAGGCFWSIEGVYDELPGVVSAVSGYSGGQLKNPSYEQVSGGMTGHAESVRIVYDPTKVSYEKLLQVFWHNIDPTVKNRQFFDAGTQYRTIIFYHNAQQKQAALKSKAELEKSGRFKTPIVTEIQPAGAFYTAEAHHQNYAHTHAMHYQAYRQASGRDAYFASVWGKDALKH